MKNNRKYYQDSKSEDYQSHKIFVQLAELNIFYKSLSSRIITFFQPGTKAINLDTYLFSSIAGTIESIYDILKKGKINDAYSLLRKYYDSTIINIYTNLYLEDNRSNEVKIVEQIENWRNGSDTIPEYRKISKYVKDSEKLKNITEILTNDSSYKEIRERCNDHTHYNFYHNVLSNDNEILFVNGINQLDIFSTDLIAVFIQHFSYLFSLNEYYMMSTDYIDAIDLGFKPEEDSQYWVAPFIQEIFDKWIKVFRPDLAKEILNNTKMRLK